MVWSLTIVVEIDILDKLLIFIDMVRCITSVSTYRPYKDIDMTLLLVEETANMPLVSCQHNISITSPALYSASWIDHQCDCGRSNHPDFSSLWGKEFMLEVKTIILFRPCMMGCDMLCRWPHTLANLGNGCQARMCPHQSKILLWNNNGIYIDENY